MSRARVFVLSSLLSVAACADPRPGAPTQPVDRDGPTTPTVGPTTPVAPCAASAGLEVLDVAVVDGRLNNDRALQVELSQAATVAAICTAAGDPSERHLVESFAEATTHELRFQGLLPETRYDCRVAPVCPTMDGDAAEVTVRTGRGEDLPALEVEVDPDLGMTGDWTLLSYTHNECGNVQPGWIVLYDAAGTPRWWYRLPDTIWIDIEALYDPADNTVTWGGGGEEEPFGDPRLVDLWSGDRYVTAFPGSAGLFFSHDAKRIPDGRLLSLDYRRFQGPDREFQGFGITLHDPETGRVDFDLTSDRYVAEGWLPLGGPPKDPYHANWVDWVEHPGGDRVYASLCEQWALMSFDAGSGDVRFKIAPGQGWTVLDPDGAPLPQSQLPQCTHGNQLIGDDVLLVYDNSQDRPQSRIVELDVDVDAHSVVVTEVWKEPGWKEGTLGDVDDLGNGRILVTQAHPECWSESPGARSSVVEVDRETGQVASRLTFPSRFDTIYRSERYDGCTLMSNVAACPALADRAALLEPVLGR